ncbi:MAG: hypothetical protein RLW61_04600 [Gammaproteobacteria bacterium]
MPKLYVMRDQARPLKADLLAGRRCLPRHIEINVDHCIASCALGILLGFVFFVQLGGAALWN